MKSVKSIFLTTLSLFFFACSKEDNTPVSPPDKSVELLTPIDSKATEPAKKLYTYFKSVYGKKTFSSTMANVAWNTTEVAHVYQLTGKYPAMNCFDFIHIHHSSPDGWINYDDISPVKNWADDGGIVSLMWHFAVPDKFGENAFYTEKTDFKPSAVFKDGSPENIFFYKQLNKVCDVLLKLQSQNIAALWRPLHEASGGWFWWGSEGSEVYVRLWKLMYEHMQQKGIHNLIWVWTTENANDDAYVDIIGRDLYGKNASQSAQEWNRIKNKYAHKMLSLSECGNDIEGRTIKTKQGYISEQWEQNQAKWLYFMPWYDYDFNEGKASVNVRCSDDFWQDAMTKSYVINRDDVKTYFSEVTYK